MKKILFVFGTRPEAIKLAPLIKLCKNSHYFKSYVCVTGQHLEMLQQVLDIFEIKPDFNLSVMSNNQSLTELTAKIITGLEKVLTETTPELVIVHGDTSTCFSATLAAYYQRIPVAHVEAGLRTHDVYSPWPEEVNRRLTASIARLHFAPTNQSKQNLLSENIKAEHIFVTGNTVIDALLMVSKKIDNSIQLQEKIKSELNMLPDMNRYILVTGHRRENFGAPFESVCRALKAIAENLDVHIVYPVHLNPRIKQPVESILGGVPKIHLIEPQNYLNFVYLMKKAFLILTDSGGIQEEAPSLGKPVFVMRENTERPEALNAGTVKLIGTDEKDIYDAVSSIILQKPDQESKKVIKNPYGSGDSAQQIINHFMEYFDKHAIQ